MSEVELLIHRAQESLKAASILVREGLSNIAASRAYYAMFYIAEALLLNKGLALKSHSAVIAAYGKEFALSKELDPKFHRYLITAFDARQIGDYGIEKEVSAEEALQLIQWAEMFLQSADDILGR